MNLLKDSSLVLFHLTLLASLTETAQRFACALGRTYTHGLLGECGLLASKPVEYP